MQSWWENLKYLANLERRRWDYHVNSENDLAAIQLLFLLTLSPLTFLKNNLNNFEKFRNLILKSSVTFEPLILS